MFSHGLFKAVILLAMLAGKQSAALPTFGELLRRHNIELTQSALLAALKNPDPEVRDLAANKLAEDGATEAIPAIVQALASEKVPWTRMNIAFALAVMGEAIGFETLEDNCKSDNTSGNIRAGSAEYLLRFNRDSNPSVRIAAGQALADLGDTRGIAELERAVGGEREEVVRLRLEEDLKILRKKIRQ